MLLVYIIYLLCLLVKHNSLVRYIKRGDLIEHKRGCRKENIRVCIERNIAVNTLANISGVSSSTVYSMLGTKSKNPGIASIKKICDGLDISIRDFFDTPLFDELEQEIK